MTVRMVSMPRPLPVTVADLKPHARVDTAEQDILLESYIEEAIEQVERVSGVGFSGATWEWYANGFPVGKIKIGFGPLTTVSSVTYHDADGVEQTLGAETYTVDDVATDGIIYPVSDWPDTEEGRPNAVKVTFTAGDGTLPGPIRNTIMRLATNAYDDREKGGELTGPAQRMVGMYRRIEF